MIAIKHLQKEQSLLNEIGLLYPTVNCNTKISMVISHCDADVKGIAIAVRDATKTPFTSVDQFLDAFRMERFPSFHNDCRIAFKVLKQNDETCMQFYFKFVYLLRAMKRNIEEYHDDFLNKLRYHKVKNWVRYYPRKGRDLHDIAAHCNEIEGSLGLHKSGVDEDSDADEDGECEHGEYGSHLGSGGHGAMALSFTRADQWCLEEGCCWHCFQQHSRSDGTCKDGPCIFCGKKGHLSIKCYSAPEGKEAFKAVLLNSNSTSSSSALWAECTDATAAKEQ